MPAILRSIHYNEVIRYTTTGFRVVYDTRVDWSHDTGGTKVCLHIKRPCCSHSIDLNSVQSMVSILTITVPPCSSYSGSTDTIPNVSTHSVDFSPEMIHCKCINLTGKTLFVLVSSKVQTLFRKMMACYFVLVCALRVPEKRNHVNYCIPFINHA